MPFPNAQIYLDYHATTPVDPQVAERVYQTMTTEFGNASSTDHAWGDRAEVEAPSPVLQALGLPDEVVEGALRIGVGKFTTDTEIEQAAEMLAQAAAEIRRLF